MTIAYRAILFQPARQAFPISSRVFFWAKEVLNLIYMINIISISLAWLKCFTEQALTTPLNFLLPDGQPGQWIHAALIHESIYKEIGQYSIHSSGNLSLKILLSSDISYFPCGAWCCDSIHSAKRHMGATRFRECSNFVSTCTTSISHFFPCFLLGQRST